MCLRFRREKHGDYEYCRSTRVYVAGALTTCAFWPQLQKTWTSKSAGDASLGMLAIFTSGVGLWLLYGVVLGAWPIIFTNAVTLLLTGAILALKLRYQS